jgi:RNA polymerase sigma-70 factor (ECF subfamily)
MKSAPLHLQPDPSRRWSMAARSAASVDGAMTDLVLVKAAQDGGRRAFDVLVTRYHPKVVKLAMRYVHHASDAEDAAQEAFIAAYRGLRRFRGDCAFNTWLHRIAVNCAKNVLIARTREARLISLDLPRGEDDAGFPKHLRELETPETLTLTDEIRGMVNTTLDTMPEGHRMAIMLRELDGLSYEEIAAAMDIPLGTVRSRVFRAREIIDRHLRAVYDAGLGRRARVRASPAAVA